MLKNYLLEIRYYIYCILVQYSSNLLPQTLHTHSTHTHTHTHAHAPSQILREYQSVGADLNVMPFCTQFIPMDVIDSPKNGSIIYHPSILPKHRGASAINW